MNKKAYDKALGKSYAMICLAVFLIVISFVNIYAAAQKSQTGNAISAAISLLAGGILFSPSLEKTRKLRSMTELKKSK